MSRSHAPATLLFVVLAAACAGPAATQLPTSGAATPRSPATMGPTPAPTSTATAAVPTEPPPTSETPTDSAATDPPPATPLPATWTERVDVAAGPSPREDHTWTANGDGTIAYLFGGRGAAGAVLSDLWQFDLTTDTWTELQPGDGPAGRFGHTATWVPDVGLVVWSGQGSRFFDDIWRYDPAVNAWEQLPSLGAVPAARYGSCASIGPDGEHWISHGFTADDGRFADTVSYNFTTGTWTDRTPAEGDLPVARCLHDCFWSNVDQTSNHLILYGGQTTGVTALGDLWVYDYQTELWSELPEQPAPARNLYALSVVSGNGMVLGGGTLDGGFLDDTWVIGRTGLTAPASELLGTPGPRSSATTIAAGDRVLLFGGMNADGVLGDLWELSPDT